MGTATEKLAYLQETKEQIRNAINARGADVLLSTPFRLYPELISEITDIPDLSNPGSANDLRDGKLLVGSDGSIITGTLSEVTQATPSISVSSSGLITVSSTQSGGIVSTGSKSSTKLLTTHSGTIITPSTSLKIACAAGVYTTGAIYVAGDSNLKAENIKEGVSIFDISGSFSSSYEIWKQNINVMYQRSEEATTTITIEASEIFCVFSYMYNYYSNGFNICGGFYITPNGDKERWAQYTIKPAYSNDYFSESYISPVSLNSSGNLVIKTKCNGNNPPDAFSSIPIYIIGKK